MNIRHLSVKRASCPIHINDYDHNLYGSTTVVSPLYNELLPKFCPLGEATIALFTLYVYPSNSYCLSLGASSVYRSASHTRVVDCWVLILSIILLTLNVAGMYTFCRLALLAMNEVRASGVSRFKLIYTGWGPLCPLNTSLQSFCACCVRSPLL